VYEGKGGLFISGILGSSSKVYKCAASQVLKHEGVGGLEQSGSRQNTQKLIPEEPFLVSNLPVCIPVRLRRPPG